MSKLNRVTITGADDDTNIQSLFDLSAEFPFVEWGILISKESRGKKAPRFPSYKWQDEFAGKCYSGASAQIAAHICGKYVEMILSETVDWDMFPHPILVPADRFQLNTHGVFHTMNTFGLENLAQFGGIEYIFQLDSVNDPLSYIAAGYGDASTIYKTSGLFDLSAGAGITPDIWPKEIPYYPCGYAGGLGPDNVLEQLTKIEAQATKPYWIDMENNVRTNEKLDLFKVHKVLEQCKAFMEG